VKKSLNYFLKQNLLAAIAVSCISVLSACQQPTETATSPTSAAKPTTVASASPSSSASPSVSPSPKTTETTTETTKTTTTTDKANSSVASLDKVVGEYKVVLDPKVLADAEKQGVKSITGKWTIKPESTFEYMVKAVSVKDEVQEIKFVGKITIEDGKLFAQIETVNGEKPPQDQVPPKQSYTLSADGKELQADGQPVKLVRL
jgi:hypothetical protein